MKTINTLVYFFIVIIALTATVALYVLGWVIYPILWLSRKSHEVWRRKVIEPLWVWLYKKGRNTDIDFEP